jgi:predicted nucleotide-binding protein
MRVGITGSWRDKDRETWGLLSDFENFKRACHQIGSALAQSRATLTVGSDSEFTADKHAVNGYLSNLSDALCVRVVRPQDGTVPFRDLHERHPDAFVYLTSSSTSWRFTRQQFVDDIDAMVTMGGAGGTYQAALELRLTRKRLVPVGGFGGASSRLLAELLNIKKAQNTSKTRGRKEDLQNFEKLNAWSVNSANHVVAVLGANRPSTVLLIHGHATDRNKLVRWLKSEKLAAPVIMGQEFTAGQTVPEKFEDLANEADAAIAIATPDDLASAVSDPKDPQFRARQNVWVEVGWFWGKLGLSRILLLVRGKVEIPSDLLGIEYLKYEQSVLELKPKIHSFLLQVGKRNQ